MGSLRPRNDSEAVGHVIHRVLPKISQQERFELLGLREQVVSVRLVNVQLVKRVLCKHCLLVMCRSLLNKL